MHSDPDALVAVIGEQLAAVKSVKAKAKAKRFRIHPLDVQVLEKRYPPEKQGYTLHDSIKRLMGVPLQWDCGVQRGHPEVDYE